MKKIREKKLLKQAFQIIHESGSDGILQVEMWKILGAHSQKGTRIALNFLNSGVIKRRKELHESRWTYRLFSLKKAVTVNSIMDCPCMPCNDIDKCTPGRFVSPLLCKKLTYWMDPNSDPEFESAEGVT